MTIVAVGVLLASSFATFGQWRWLIGVYPTVADTELDRLDRLDILDTVVSHACGSLYEGPADMYDHYYYHLEVNV